MKRVLDFVVITWPVALIVGVTIITPPIIVKAIASGLVLGAFYISVLFLHFTEVEGSKKDDGYDKYGVKRDPPAMQ